MSASRNTGSAKQSTAAWIALAAALLLFLPACASQQAGTSPTTADGQATEQGADDATQTDGQEGEADEAEQQPADTEEQGAGEESAQQDGSDEAAQQESKPGNPELAQQLRSQLKEASQASGMLTGTAVIDLTDGTHASYRGNKKIVSASMIKLLIAYSFLEHSRQEGPSLSDTYTLRSEDLVGGAGVLSGYGAGAQVTYRDILRRMIDNSDNTAANILIDAVGMDAINDTARSLGLRRTRLNRHMMDQEAVAAGLENYTCANDIARLLQMVYDGDFVSRKRSKLVLKALENQQDTEGILAGLPAGTTFAHKTGELATVRHDGGIVEGEHPYVLVVLCGGDGFSMPGAHSTMAEISSTVHATITGA